MEAGKTQTYAPGLPNFDMEAIATRRGDRSGVDLHIGIPYRSLTFEKDSAGFISPYEFQIEVLDPEDDRLVDTQSWTDTVHVSSREATQRYRPISLTRRFDLAPDRYEFRVVLQDLNSENRAARRVEVDVPEFSTSEPKLSQVYLQARTSDRSFEPVVSLHIPADVDSLRALTELYNMASANTVEIEAHFLRFDSDHSIAQPPDAITPMSGSMEYKGTDYDEVDTVQTQRYTLENPADSLLLTFDQPAVEPGMYRVSISARALSTEDTTTTRELHQQRTLSIKSAAFPEVTSLDEMVDALTYIARDEQLEEIRSHDSTEERRRAFDSFWGRISENREEASKLVETYYNRVEDANRFFTSHKEGWKTDRGMVYIVYGPPIRVERYVNQEIWYYGYSARDERDQYVFTRGRRYDQRGPLFNNFILQRQPYYRRDWDRAVNNWRSGDIPYGT